MKNIFTFFLSLLLVTIVLQQKATAQINFSAYDSSQVACSPPSTVDFTGYIYTILYADGDLITFYINFGDGSDTTFQMPIYQNSYAGYYFQHTYTSPGYFSVLHIATGPDGTADTVINNNVVFVGTSCGTLEGRIYGDENSNCIYDSGDIPYDWGIVTAVSTGANPIHLYGYTDASGMYYIDAPMGFTYDINTLNLSNIFNITCPAGGNYTSVSPSATGLDFALECIPGFDLDGYLWGWGFTPGSSAGIVEVEVFNNYCYPVTGVLKVVIDPLVTYTSASLPPTSIQGDTLIWDPFTYNPYYSYNFPTIEVECSTSVNAQLGDPVCFKMIEEPIAGDADPLNNVHTACYNVQSSWDPNAKDVNPKGTITGDQRLDYTVLFQNTGTAPATNIYIIDTLDSNLDVLTFALTTSSAPCDVTFLGEHIVKFYFNNINLPDSNTNEPGSHGFVNYSISPKQGLEDGMVISNTAAIYFDFNPAVITNTVSNTIDNTLGIQEPGAMANIQLYPNPAFNTITVETSNSTSILLLTDISGKVLKTWNLAGYKNEVNVSDVADGMYFIVSHAGNKTMQAKLVVLH